ncbi:outer membrane beta-barrel protein [Flavobacterium cyclinae]|uniref:outer membrane beta-barrel protein n=1 Tax=Flavobacterium cyclinae TaxID=2895947 RepID=UPI001E3D59F1|nr:outer membrane beta-barrel protein [Flavobacterium cyclinae]UGS22065.1 outer membrane beta-barrel protein [Flavobacterium cyclinae]
MKKTLFILLLNLNFALFSQESKLSIELNYPIPADNNFIGKNYTGIVDIGGKYKIIDKNILDFGIALNAGLLKYNNSKINSSQNYKIYAYPIQPKIFCEFNIKNIKRLHPYTSLGYSFIIFKATGTNNGFDISDLNDTQAGINLNFGLSYDITSKLFVNGQFDFTKLQEENGIPNTTFNTNVNLVKFGIGLRL